MKKIFFLFIGLMLCTAAFAQDQRVRDSIFIPLTQIYPHSSVVATSSDENHVYCFLSIPEAVNYMTDLSQDRGRNDAGSPRYDNVEIHIIKDNTLTKSIVIPEGKNVTLLDDKTVTSRGNVSTTLITVNQNATLTLGASDEDDTLVFDGGNMGKYFPFVSNKGTLIINGNVIFQNNSNTSGGSAIQIEQDGKMIVNGDLVFQDNTTTGNGGAVLMNERSTLDIYGKTKFLHNIAGNNGGAISMKSSSAFTVHEGAEVDFIGNKAKLGSSIYASSGSVYLNGIVNVKKNVAENGSLYAYFGKQYISGKVTISEDTITNGALIYNIKTSLKMSDGEIMNNFIKGNASDCYGVIAVLDANDTLVGGKIHDNVISVDNAQNLSPKPASVVLSLTNGIKRLYLGDSTMVDTINLVHKDKKNQVVWLLSNLTKVSATSPIILQVDTFDVNVFQQLPLIATNYMKFKPSSDTLAINNKGYVVRKPEISIDTVYLLQKGTKYEDYGITTSTGEVPAEALYVIYTQEVDATGQSAKTTADSLVLNMSVDFNHGSPVMLDKKVLSNNQNTNTFVEIPFPSALTEGALSTGRYTINATAKVYTLGLEASDDFTQSDSVYIPTFTIDTLNFLLAGMKFSDYGHCGVGSSTNDGADDDIIPWDEIYVGYQRSEGGNVDTAFIKVTLKDYNDDEYVYEEGTAVGQILEPGCGHFRQFTNSEKWNQALNLSDAFDGKDFTYTINIHTKTQGEPYFAVGTKTGSYHHEIDRECTLALENAEACNAMGIQFAVNATNDTISLTYPNFFDKNAVPEEMKQDGVIKVGISFDPQDEKLTMAWFDEAMDITADGKYIVWIPISKAIPETSPIVVAENYAITPDTLRLSHTEVNDVYRKTFVVEGTYTKAIVNRANVSYHTTGASGVKFALDEGIYYKVYFDANDYTVWNVQNPQSFGKSNNNVYAGLYVNRPADTINAVYSTFNDFAADTVTPLVNDPTHQMTDTAYIQYVKIGDCANQEAKDYTFITKPSNETHDYNYKNINGRIDTVYWFKDNKFVKAERYTVRYYYAPQYTVNFNFNGGGATCNDPYSDTFADTTYVFGRPIVRPDDPFKCGHLFMDWRHGVDSFTVDSFKNVRSGISEATGETVENEAFGIRSNMVLDAAWKYFITIEGLRDTAVVANYSLCEINTRDYVWEPTEDKRPYCYTYHKDYLGHEYRYYIPGKNGNCDVRFGDSVYLESPKLLPVGQTPQVTWTVTDMCGTPFTLTQNVNVMFPPCGTDNYDPAESAYDRVNNNHGSLDVEYLASIDGKDDYRTVRIGCNCWLKENLQNENYADGSSIAIAKAYLNDETKVPEFGRLYTWYSAVNVPEGDDNTQPATANETITFSQTSNTYSRDYVQGVCPDGWHIPALAEYQNLKDLVGTANAIKAVGGNYWLGYQDATDAAEFTGVPGGYYDNTTDRYFNILGKAYFWSTENYGVKALPCSLLYGCPEILFNEQNKYYGVSVRCVRNIKISY